MLFYKARYPAWYSSKEDWKPYWHELSHFCAGKVLADIGCGNAEIWTADLTPTYKFLHLLDIVLPLGAHSNVSKLPKDKVSLWHASAGILNHINNQVYQAPTVALLRDVCQFLTYSEIRALLFGLPKSITTLIITTKYGQAEPSSVKNPPVRAISWASSPFNFRFAVNKLAGSPQNLFLFSVTHDLSKWIAAQDGPGIWEPCLQCGSTDHVDSCVVTNLVEVMCMNCGTSYSDKGTNVHVPYEMDAQNTRHFWNRQIRKTYRFTDQ